MNGSLPGPATPGSDSLRIIILENHAMMGSCLRLYLESRGHSVLIAATALEASAAMSENRFDALIADVYLGGETCASVLRERSTLPPKVITMSGYGFRKKDLGFLNQQPWPHLTKPFEAEALDALLRDKISE